MNVLTEYDPIERLLADIQRRQLKQVATVCKNCPNLGCCAANFEAVILKLEDTIKAGAKR